MLDDSDRLLGTVEQVLKAGEAGYKRGKRQPTEIDFSGLVRECVELARSGIISSQKACIGTGQRTVPHVNVQGDPDDLRTAVSNILDNAIKYSGGTMWTCRFRSTRRTTSASYCACAIAALASPPRS